MTSFHHRWILRRQHLSSTILIVFERTNVIKINKLTLIHCNSFRWALEISSNALPRRLSWRRSSTVSSSTMKSILNRFHQLMVSNTLKHFWNFNDFMSLKFTLFYFKSAYVKAFLWNQWSWCLHQLRRFKTGPLSPAFQLFTQDTVQKRDQFQLYHHLKNQKFQWNLWPQLHPGLLTLLSLFWAKEAKSQR